MFVLWLTFNLAALHATPARAGSREECHVSACKRFFVSLWKAAWSEPGNSNFLGRDLILSTKELFRINYSAYSLPALCTMIRAIWHHWCRIRYVMYILHTAPYVGPGKYNIVKVLTWSVPRARPLQDDYVFIQTNFKKSLSKGGKVRQVYYIRGRDWTECHCTLVVSQYNILHIRNMYVVLLRHISRSENISCSQAPVMPWYRDGLAEVLLPCVLVDPWAS